MTSICISNNSNQLTVVMTPIQICIGELEESWLPCPPPPISAAYDTVIGKIGGGGGGREVMNLFCHRWQKYGGGGWQRSHDLKF